MEQGKAEEMERVEETSLRRRRTLDALKERREATFGAGVQQKRKVYLDKPRRDRKVRRPDQFVHAARVRQGSAQRQQRMARQAKRRADAAVARERKASAGKSKKAKRNARAFVIHEDKPVLVLRTRQARDAAPSVKRVLQALDLHHEMAAVLLRMNRQQLVKLESISPYVVWGYPSQRTISELVRKRGFARQRAEEVDKTVEGFNIDADDSVDNPEQKKRLTRRRLLKERVPLSGNQQVEDALGRFNLICVEDLVDELYNVGENFDRVKRFLWPFRLAAPRGGMQTKLLRDFEEGMSGPRQDNIDDLVALMM